MRNYGLSDLLGTISEVTGIDVPTLRSRHVDLDRAIIALRAGGGKPVSSDETVDVAHGCYRLLRHLLSIRPWTGKDSDRVALQATIAYAAARNHTLNLGPNRMHFVNEVGIGGLGEKDILRALLRSLTPNAEPRAPEQALLAGCTAALSFAISDPTPELVRVSRYLRTGLSRWMERQGGALLVPRPQHRRTTNGQPVDIPYIEGSQERATTEEIFTRSIARITGAHAQIILSDPRSSGSAVEREWALRCGKPVFELGMSMRVHPHADAPPAVTAIAVDLLRPRDALHVACQELTDRAWLLQDARATAQALELKNREELAHLRTAWDGLTDEEQIGLTQMSHMSRPYIQGLLSNTSALELASRAQRIALAALTDVATYRPPSFPVDLTEQETLRLTAAALRLGLHDIDLVQTVQLAGQQLRRAYAFSRLIDDEEADRAIAAAVALRRTRVTFDD